MIEEGLAKSPQPNDSYQASHITKTIHSALGHKMRNISTNRGSVGKACTQITLHEQWSKNPVIASFSSLSGGAHFTVLPVDPSDSCTMYLAVLHEGGTFHHVQ